MKTVWRPLFSASAAFKLFLTANTIARIAGTPLMS